MMNVNCIMSKFDSHHEIDQGISCKECIYNQLPLLKEYADGFTHMEKNEKVNVAFPLRDAFIHINIVNILILKMNQ